VVVVLCDSVDRVGWDDRFATKAMVRGARGPCEIRGPAELGDTCPRDGAEPVFHEATDGSNTLQAGAQPADLPYRIVSVEVVTFPVIIQKGRPVGSTAHVRYRIAQVNTWVDGMIVRSTGYNDIDEARAAAERLAEERG
jgi:hypothetical protein